MKVKKCRTCGEVKPLTDFRENRNDCRVCESEKSKARQKTKKGLVTKIYNQQKSSSKKRGHPMPTYSNKELREWMYSQSIFHELYDRWKSSDYNQMLTPSCDRLDDYKPYTLSNLQIVTWHDNKHRHYEDVKNGINNKYNVAVLQFDLNGTFVAEYYSIAEAKRQTGINHIWDVCSGIRKVAGGYTWKYKNK